MYPLPKLITPKDFQDALGEPLTDFLAERIQASSLQYAELTEQERDELLLVIFETLSSPNLTHAGEQRLPQWEAGWSENLSEFNGQKQYSDALVPKYFEKYKAIRWRGRLVKPLSHRFELHSLYILLDWIFDKYFRQATSIYEFGCGTAHNLCRLRRVNPDATLWGLDWAESSQRLIEKIGRAGVCKNIHGRNFNYFTPDYSLSIAPCSMVYTVASLEQIGERWRPFIDYLIAQKPALCVHIEPIEELLNPEVLIENLSIRYFRKRNYLSGFLSGLRALEHEGKIAVLRAQRTGVGSLFIEGYSIVVWRPL